MLGKKFSQGYLSMIVIITLARVDVNYTLPNTELHEKLQESAEKYDPSY